MFSAQNSNVFVQENFVFTFENIKKRSNFFQAASRSEEASQTTCGSAADADAAADVTNFRTRDWLTFADLKCSKNVVKFKKKFQKIFKKF